MTMGEALRAIGLWLAAVAFCVAGAAAGFALFFVLHYITG